MPPMRIPVVQLSQGVRTFASQSARRTLAHRVPVLHHEPSQRILQKAADVASHQLSSASFPLMVRDASSYGALGAVTTMAAFMIYCADKDADMMDLLTTPDSLG
ncbi:hypothetical protein PV11_01081 [Exophiala sideris]|uniref:Uncharacterized protein n=1 Tax=Exophiala sideris TaxID=1016849 RepID=A0A0D1YRQ3_9EURO|nr:hypothetical protein PV11_01081 [Exophiala sideris]